MRMTIACDIKTGSNGKYHENQLRLLLTNIRERAIVDGRLSVAIDGVNVDWWDELEDARAREIREREEERQRREKVWRTRTEPKLRRAGWRSGINVVNFLENYRRSHHKPLLDEDDELWYNVPI
jgi:hypothetical protein